MRRTAVVVAALLSLTGIFVVAAPTPVAAAGCSLAPTGLMPRTLNGRRYLVHVPPGLTAPAPLVVSLHGFGATAEIHAANTLLVPYADAHKFIVAFPQGAGTPSSWNFGHNSADVAFVRAVVADIESGWCVDPHRVFATGHSNGALMSMRLACDAADLFGAVAEYAGGPPTITGSACVPSRPISVGIFSSTFDFLSLEPFGLFTRNQWLQIDHCPATPHREAGVLLEATRYGPCAAGTEVVWRAYLFQSHNWPIDWPFSADGTDILNRMWGLFQRNPLP